jgi:hypothetical protein
MTPGFLHDYAYSEEQELDEEHYYIKNREFILIMVVQVV